MPCSRFFLIPILCLVNVYANLVLASGSEWNDDIAKRAHDPLNTIESKQEHHFAGLGPRDSAARSSYWKPLRLSQREPPSDFEAQLADVANQLTSSLNTLWALIQREYNIGPPVIASGSSHPTVYPITFANSHGSYPTPGPSSTPTAAASSSSSSSQQTPSGTYAFNPQASDLNIVYYSQTDLTKTVTLTQVCSDPSVDVVILAFITSLFGKGGYPSMNMASNCWAPSAAQQNAGATGLLDCVGDGFAVQISSCQSLGKKVLISMGGIYSNLQISSTDQATQAAQLLWNLFLGGTDAATAPLRPYGSVVLDGIDLDNENPSNAQYMPSLMAALRTLMATDSAKSYYLSAAPQCPQPDQSILVPGLLDVVDFFNVQFYNNPSCQLGSGQGFLDSLTSWSSSLLLPAVHGGPGPSSRPRSPPRRKRSRASLSTRRTQIPPASFGDAAPGASSNGGGGGDDDNDDNTGFMNINNGVTYPRLLVGTPAFGAAGTGYVTVAQYKDILEQVKALRLPNVAGAMFWDGAYEIRSGAPVDGAGTNKTYVQVVRDVLG
ncbi:hypothetical protein PV08_03599 [Exophiala spinifera]|uniref:chitinase n=1 Tax=Exophiala spinifera TaxID=91928 RepID=A0A0D2BL30_9EURO|nr:uncharacterized protein PV08_03599 [Exophiala spinifera]KIW19305.1 hypothetical protein PV08_03599 [Exophiala spinifera]